MKKRWRRSLAILLAALVITASCPAAAQAAQTAAEEPEAEESVLAETGDPDEQPEGTEAVPVDETAAPVEEPTEVPQKEEMTLRFDNTSEGTVVSWEAVEGAQTYRLSVLEDEVYAELAVTEELSFPYTPLEDGRSYTYRIEALDGEGDVIGENAPEGESFTFLAPPEIVALTMTAQGVSVCWTPRNAERYRVYRRTAKTGWRSVGETGENSFTDTTAPSGDTYIYTVRCISADRTEYRSYYTDGKSLYYVKTPTVTGFENTATGVKVSWQKPAGADKVRLFCKKNGVWTRIGETAGHSLVHDKLIDGTEYTYTLRCLDKKGNFVSAYNGDGWNNTFIKPPVITSLLNTDKGIKLTWSGSPKAEKYRVYVYNNGWKKLTDTTSTSYVHTGVASGTKYTYTVRCINNAATRFTSYFNSGRSRVYIGVPTISSISNVATGTQLTWKKPTGANKVRVFYKNDKGVWTAIGETTGTTFTHDKLTGGKTYTYTLRCVDGSGYFSSDYNHTGWNNKFIKPPVITSFTNTDKGVMIRWNKPAGAEKFRVYYYGSRGWTKMADTEDTFYLDTDVNSGGNYTYTVRCINKAATRFTSYFPSGKKTQYIGVPQITGFSNTRTGTQITWKNPGGAQRYRVFVFKDSVWQCIKETTATSFVYNNLSNNRSYTYTVRCVNGSGSFVSSYNSKGWSYTFIKPPTLSSVSRSGSANTVKWSAVTGASSYRVYRKGFNGSWSRIADRVAQTGYNDNGAGANTLYAYTVRCLNKNGALVSDYYDTNVYYYNGKLAQGGISVNGSKLYFDKGKVISGFQKINGKVYYYGPNGIEKNKIVGTSSTGYYYAGSDGAIDYGYCNGITQNGTDWNVIDGRASRVSGDSDRTLFRALKLVYSLTDSDMSRSDKLWICFRHIQTSYTEMNPRIPDYTGMDWPIIYANDVFVDNRGNCLSFAAAFAYMAKACGYTEVYGCHSGGHGWAEIDGLIYDPEWGMHHFKYSYYGMTYSEPCDQNYSGAISAGYAWMHIKI